MFLRTITARTFVRRNSTLADKIRRASHGEVIDEKNQRIHFESVQLDANGEEFREPFLIPKRKLRGQIQIEQATGRTAIIKRSRPDIFDRLAVRKDRSSEISTEAEWSDIWPSAKTFNASVVPLPVRMGSRRDPEKRAPFKKHGNLELVKIPNFLHLTPGAIEKHCEAIKQFCTEFPKELIGNKSLLNEEFPVSLSYNSYVHQGTNIRDNRARVVTLQIPVASLKLTDIQKEKLLRLAGSRYNEEADILTIITDRCHTRQQNIDYADYLLTVLFHESKKLEAWENMKTRKDHTKVEFKGSKCEEQLISTLKKISCQDHLTSSVKNLGSNASNEQIASHPSVNKFAEMYHKYRNEEETSDATRQYAIHMRELLGIPSIDKSNPTTA